MNQPRDQKQKFDKLFPEFEAFKTILDDKDEITMPMPTSNLFALAADIEKHSHYSVCQEAGERYDNAICQSLGWCSWFRHSQDPYRHSTASNLPEGFVEP